MKTTIQHRTIHFTGVAAGPAPLPWAQETTWQNACQVLPDVLDWFVIDAASRCRKASVWTPCSRSSVSS